MNRKQPFFLSSLSLSLSLSFLFFSLCVGGLFCFVCLFAVVCLGFFGLFVFCLFVCLFVVVVVVVVVLFCFFLGGGLRNNPHGH